jgi:hypothetical protein
VVPTLERRDHLRHVLPIALPVGRVDRLQKRPRVLVERRRGFAVHLLVRRADVLHLELVGACEEDDRVDVLGDQLEPVLGLLEFQQPLPAHLGHTITSAAGCA